MTVKLLALSLLSVGMVNTWDMMPGYKFVQRSTHRVVHSAVLSAPNTAVSLRMARRAYFMILRSQR